MLLNLKNIVGAGLLTVAIVGSIAALLGTTLKPAPMHHTLVGEVSEPTPNSVRHADVIVTEGRAS